VVRRRVPRGGAVGAGVAGDRAEVGGLSVGELRGRGAGVSVRTFAWSKTSTSAPRAGSSSTAPAARLSTT
jgi:hypothetical protein